MMNFIAKPLINLLVEGRLKMPLRKRRCELITPAVNRGMIEKSSDLPVDQIILDLEDSVVEERKKEARHNAIAAFNELCWGGKIRSVRINSVRSPWCYHDILEIVKGAGNNLDTLIIPKVKGAQDLYFIDLFLSQLETEIGMDCKVGIECMIEQPEAVEYIRDIVFSTSRLEALIFGAADFAAAMGIPILDLSKIDEESKYPGHRWHYVLNQMAVTGRVANLQLIGGSFPGYDNDGIKNYRLEAEYEKALGFDGKWAIHPNQVSVATEVFTPSDKIIEQARKLKNAFNEAVEKGLGAIVFDGQMVDYATIEVAERILVRQE